MRTADKEKPRKVSTGRKIARIIGIVIACILAVAVILIAVYHRAAGMLINNWRYPTDQQVSETAWDNGETYLKVQYADVSDSDYLDLYVPSDVENPPLLVIIHGGGFITGDTHTAQAQKMYLYFRDHGYACASINYRLAQEAAFPACVQDVKAAIRFLRSNAAQYGYDGDHIAVFGESAGGYLACMAAFTNDDEFNDLPFIGEESTGEEGNSENRISAQVQVLIDYYGCVELTDKNPDWRAEGVPSIVINLANSWLSGDVLQGYDSPEDFLIRGDVDQLSSEELAKITPGAYAEENLGTAISPAIWIAHGDSDITVPIGQSERLYQEVVQLEDESRIHYEEVAHAGHAGRLMYTDEELARVEEFMRPYLHN